MNPDFHVEREKYGLRNPDESECEIRINSDVAHCEMEGRPDFGGRIPRMPSGEAGGKKKNPDSS